MLPGKCLYPDQFGQEFSDFSANCNESINQGLKLNCARRVMRNRTKRIELIYLEPFYSQGDFHAHRVKKSIPQGNYRTLQKLNKKKEGFNFE